MSDENKKDPKKGGEFRVPPRTWILWIVILGAIPLLLLFKERPDAGNHILDRVDPAEWALHNPWNDLNFNVVVQLSKRAYNRVRKELGMERRRPGGTQR